MLVVLSEGLIVQMQWGRASLTALNTAMCVMSSSILYQSVIFISGLKLSQ